MKSTALCALALLAFSSVAAAAPQAHILRIDPTAGVTNGTPILTTVVEVVQFNRLSDALTPCAAITGYDQTLDCWSKAIEKPGALWSPFPFPEANAHFFVNVAGADTLTKFDSKEQWGAVVGKEAGVGTAWLIALDASSGMGARYADARVVAEEFIKAMQPNDLMDLMIFDDRPRQYVADSKWKTYAQRNDLIAVLNQIKSPMPSHGSDRPLFSQIQQMTQDSFGDLGNTKGPQMIPLHQAMVVLSDGAGHGDPASLSPTAGVFAQYLDQGRFPADNTSLPKTPLPVISIWFPSVGGYANALYKDNDSQFMQSLANVEIGGYFDIVRGGQGATKAAAIIGLVKQRFNAMWIVKWRLSCLNPTVTQSFNLVFQNTNPVIAPDGSFKDVPIGVDPTVWPLDVDMAKTVAESQANPIYPGGTFRVYGDFCWSGDKTRAEAYFVPAGTAPNANANSADPAVAKQAMQTLIAENMRGSSTDVGDAFAVFNVPNDAKLLDGTGENMVARVVIYDNKASRTSGHDAKSILTLHARAAPFNVLLISGIAGGVVVVGLLLVVLMRGGGGGGGGKRRRANTPPPAPVVAGGGPPPYGAPPGGTPPYGAPPPPGGGGYPGGGYQGGGGGYQAVPLPPPGGQMGFDATAAANMGGPAAVIQVRCPSCSMMTMATPGQAGVCFSCGQPLPASAIAQAQGGGGGAYAPTFPLTGGMAALPQPPANPYGDPRAAMPPMNSGGGGATIFGPSGQFAIRPGTEMRVGRDPAQCAVFLQEPRVSGWHSTLKFEGGRLWVRDEGSNNGTYLDGARIAAQTWTPVTPGAQLRFGPIEFGVRADA
ncbi:MAG: FHA domain-containing protein [Polyangiaceae bacterium]